jgi:hypothetical protein
VSLRKLAWVGYRFNEQPLQEQLKAAGAHPVFLSRKTALEV